MSVLIVKGIHNNHGTIFIHEGTMFKWWDKAYGPGYISGWTADNSNILFGFEDHSGLHKGLEPFKDMW